MEREAAPDPGSWARPGKENRSRGRWGCWVLETGARGQGSYARCKQRKHWGVFVRQGAICRTQNQDAHSRSKGYGQK